MIKCLQGTVKSPLDKLTPSSQTLSDPFPALDRMLWFHWALKDTQVAKTHRYKVFLCSIPGTHTFLVGNALHQKLFKKIYFIPTVTSAVVMFQTVLPMHKVQHWKTLWEFQYHTSFPSATTLSTELCCSVSVENKKGRKGKLATDQ